MRQFISFGLGIGIGAMISHTILKYFDKPEENIDKYRSYYNLMNKWWEQEEVGRPIGLLLQEAGYKQIAIYGIGNIGERLNNSLRNSNIEVIYAIDKNASDSETGLKVYSSKDSLPKVDAIIVTIPFAYTNIKETLENHTDIPIVSLEHILFEV